MFAVSACSRLARPGARAPVDVLARNLAGAKGAYEALAGDLGQNPTPASEDVNGGVSVLRPGVDGQVGFGDHDHAAHPVRGEAVKGGPDDGCPSLASGSPPGRLARLGGGQ